MKKIITLAIVFLVLSKLGYAQNFESAVDSLILNVFNDKNGPGGVFMVAKDGKPIGPFDVVTLKTMIASGDFNSDSLVWKEGMSEWQKASIQSELAGIFPPKL